MFKKNANFENIKFNSYGKSINKKSFLKELEALAINYDAVFVKDGEGISILIYEGDEDISETERLKKSIHFENSFDENEIQELLKKSCVLFDS